MDTVLLVLIPVAVIVFGIWYFCFRKKEKSDSPEQVVTTQEPQKPKEEEKPKGEPKEEPKEKEKPSNQEISPYSQDAFEQAVRDFSNVIVTSISVGGDIWNYLYDLFNEARTQYCGKTSVMGLPALYKIENFPYVMNYYNDKGDEASAFRTFIGWLFALALAELKPQNRTELFKYGYEYGGYSSASNIFGYKFEYDPNVARMVASALYAAMKGILTYNWDEMRKYLGGIVYDESLKDIKESDSMQFGIYDFYIDFMEFMPTAPGPYAPGYKKRTTVTYPMEEKTDDGNLYIDKLIHERIVSNYNLDNKEFHKRTVQAIADKEADLNHLFGEDGVYDKEYFHAVFGKETIGETISPDSTVALLCNYCLYISSYSRDVLQDKKTKQYGRLRPGCSWEKEAAPHSTTDDRWNALVDFDIEDNDGCPTGYYDKNGKWVYPDEIDSPEEYKEYYQSHLYANSYPSGHSAGIQGVAMTLMRLLPHSADLILKAANQFAINRTVARYHWTSDTINGRIVGAATNAVCGAVEEYQELIEKCKEEL